jgi:hypothetical protein
MAGRKKTLIDGLDRNANLFGRTIERINDKLSGQGENDEELSVYMKLAPEHFQQLSNEFGFDSVSQYIKDMEAKRLRRK